MWYYFIAVVSIRSFVFIKHLYPEYKQLSFRRSHVLNGNDRYRSSKTALRKSRRSLYSTFKCHSFGSAGEQVGKANPSSKSTFNPSTRASCFHPIRKAPALRLACCESTLFDTRQCTPAQLLDNDASSCMHVPRDNLLYHALVPYVPYVRRTVPPTYLYLRALVRETCDFEVYEPSL